MSQVLLVGADRPQLRADEHFQALHSRVVGRLRADVFVVADSVVTKAGSPACVDQARRESRP